MIIAIVKHIPAKLSATVVIAQGALFRTVVKSSGMDHAAHAQTPNNVASAMVNTAVAHRIVVLLYALIDDDDDDENGSSTDAMDDALVLNSK